VTRALLVGLVVALLGGGALVALPPSDPPQSGVRQPRADAPLLVDEFDQPPGLITNAWAYYHPYDPAGRVSPVWQVTSGSLFARGDRAWTGAPDLAQPDLGSSAGSGSAVFRLRSRRADLLDVEVRARVRVLQWTDVWGGSPDAVVLWARYQSEQHLYLINVLTSAGTVSAAKKVPAGPSPRNGGTYFTLPPYVSQRAAPVELGRWYEVGLQVCTGPGGRTSLTVLRDGEVVHQVEDVGVGSTVQLADTGALVTDESPPISEPGRVGVRADDAGLEIDRFEVRSLLDCPTGTAELQH